MCGFEKDHNSYPIRTSADVYGSLSSSGGRCFTASAELLRGGNVREITPCEHVREQHPHLATDLAVMSQDLPRVQPERRTIKARNCTTSLFHKQGSCGGVPGVQVELPVPVDTPC